MSLYVVNRDSFGLNSAVAVLDTSDGVIEWEYEDKIRDYLCRGIKIIGITAKPNEIVKMQRE